MRITGLLSFLLLCGACNWSPEYNRRTWLVESDCEGGLKKQFIVDPLPSRRTIAEALSQEGDIDNPNVKSVSFDGNAIHIQFASANCDLSVFTEAWEDCRNRNGDAVCRGVATLVSVDEQQAAGSPAQY